MNDIKIGFGYDIHRLIKGNSITLGGLSFPSKKMIDAHSDGDIILHSLSNAILSSVGKEDIGYFFSDQKEETKDMPSTKILSLSLDLLKKEGYKLNNVVITIITQEPKINPIREQIVSSLSKLLNINISNIAVHSGTKESCGEVGKGKAIECYSTISVIK